MQMEKIWQFMGWFLDRFEQHGDHLLKVSLPPFGSGAGQGIARVFDLKKGKYVELTSKAFPVEDLEDFLRWLNILFAVEKDVVVAFPASPGKTTSGSGVLTFPGKTIYFHCLNYCEGDDNRHMSEISFSYHDMPSDTVRNRFDALQVIKQHKIKEPLNDKALMQVAVALKNAESHR